MVSWQHKRLGEGGGSGDPEVAQLLHLAEGQLHLRAERVVVVGSVPHKPEKEKQHF